MSKTKLSNGYFRAVFNVIKDLSILLLSTILALLIIDPSHNIITYYGISVIIWGLFMSVIYSTMFFFSGIHNIIWKYCSTFDLIKYALIIVFSSIVNFVAHFTTSAALITSDEFQNTDIRFRLPTSVYVFGLMISLILILGIVVAKRAIGYSRSTVNYSESKDNSTKYKNVMIIGGGYSGNLIINDLRHNASNKDYRVSCIIDDNPEKLGKKIQGVPIVGNTFNIEKYAKEYDISTIIFAIATCSPDRKSEILKLCAKTGCLVKTIPTTVQIINGDTEISKIRPIEIEDLLGRDPIKIDLEKILNYVENKTIMVTGGGGSIGSELCRQIASHKPKKLIIFDIYENNAYDIENEIKSNYPELDLHTLIGSVRDTSRLNSVLSAYKPDIIYHAAAHKHVPLMEDSPNEAIKNNVLGTYKLVRAADKHNVKRFVMISTDKAVNPTNIMGATKRICEMIVQTFNSHSKCEFVAVRFGNVLGSNGSVIPLFKRQIAAGGPVTVTHPDIIRYFMTIPEAVSLVLQAGASAKGGEIFVLNMGSPVKIVDLAKNLITLMGYVPDKDIKIDFTGLRPGEKLYEELLLAEEGLKATESEMIYIGHPIDIDESMLFDKLNELEQVMYDDTSDVRAIVKELVPTYNYKK